MCFDGKTLSSYVDGELDSAQISSIKEHLDVCIGCREKTESFSFLINIMKDSKKEFDSFTRETIWTRLAHSTSTDKGLDFLHRRFFVSPSVLISLSFLFIAIVGMSIYLAVPKETILLFPGNDFAFDSEKFPLEIPIDTIENLLEYFDIHDEPVEVFIELPSASNFVIQGEPRFLKKIDYLADR